ncbi:MAG: hypothetical protein AAF938_07920 [Myxococcota bacterium]
MTQGRGRGKISAEAAAAEIVRGLRRGRDEVFVGKAKILRVLVALSPWLAAWLTRRW